MKFSFLLSACAVMLTVAAQAHASEIIFRGINPEITPTANPANETAISNFYNVSKPTVTTPTTQLSESDLLKQSIISGLSSTYQTLLTGANSGNGTLNLGDGNSAVYSTVGNTRYITFYNADGTSTSISFPIN